MKDTFYVVETDDDIYLGMVEFDKGRIIIRNGFVGRPIEVLSEDLVQMYPAEMHPAVVSKNYIQAV